MRIAILIPTLGRAESLAPLLDNIRDTTPVKQFEAVFIADPEDHDTRNELFRLGGLQVLRDGTFPVKVNAGLRASWQELVLIAADDVVFHPGWYEAAAEAFVEGVDVIGGPDLSPITEGGSHVTMPIVRRSYIEDPGAVWGETGTVFHEGYHHGWVETELWQLACHRGVARFVEGCIIEHRHPDWGTRERDDTDVKGNMQHKPEDQALFEQRKGSWSA